MQPVEQAAIMIGQLEIRYLMDGTVSGAASGMFEVTVPPGARVPPAHSHTNNEEMMYCLEGTLRSTVGDEVCDLKPGEQSYTPRGVVHAFSKAAVEWWEDLWPAYNEKYGKPTRVERGTVRTRIGAVFPNTVATWSNRESSIVLEQRAGNIDDMRITYVHEGLWKT